MSYPNRARRRQSRARRRLAWIAPVTAGVKNMARRLRDAVCTVKVENPERYLHASRT